MSVDYCFICCCFFSSICLLLIVGKVFGLDEPGSSHKMECESQRDKKVKHGREKLNGITTFGIWKGFEVKRHQFLFDCNVFFCVLLFGVGFCLVFQHRMYVMPCVKRLNCVFHVDSADESYVKITIGFRCVFELAKRVMFIYFFFVLFSAVRVCVALPFMQSSC